ncbi:MAG: sorbosone dehydrogenase family protein [Gammaproteobacteria bacterium]
MVAVLAIGAVVAGVAPAFDADDLVLPPGFSIATYAEGVSDARQLAIGANGTVFAGSREAGLVHAIHDDDGDGRAERVELLAEGLYMPSGIAYRDGSLFVAAVSRILRFDGVDGTTVAGIEPTVVVDDLPADAHHGWKFIAFGPDGRLYVPVGAPCNVCDPPPPYATILSMTAEGGERTVVARGVRNSVGFDWNPAGGELWFSDNGRDWLGDDRPPGEINRVTTSGQHFGFPFRHGDDLSDPEFGGTGVGREYVAPALALGAHVAPLGVEFYQGQAFPERYRGALFVAEHGSWNRTQKAGYRVMVAFLDEDGLVTGYEPFVTGWLRGQAYWGRPVDFATLSDGSLLLSDDHGGRIYRVTYAAP